jgi:hypothetical protein
MRWKEFVGNRVSLIQETLPEAHWKFIAGKQNPADCASRGLSASQLIHHLLWWTGPAWLSQPPEFWPLKVPPRDDLEQRTGLSYACPCFKKIPNSKLSVSPINPADLDNAKLFWIKRTHQAYYSSSWKTSQGISRIVKIHCNH